MFPAARITNKNNNFFNLEFIEYNENMGQILFHFSLKLSTENE